MHNIDNIKLLNIFLVQRDKATKYLKYVKQIFVNFSKST